MPEVHASRVGSARPRLLWLALGILAAVGLRGGWLARFSEAINGEGAEYTRIAENLVAGRGYVGIATEGAELMFAPLYPLAIAAVSFLTGSSHLAALLVALAAGVVVVLAVYGIARDLYGDTAGLVAAGIAAVHPVLVKLSGTAYVEGPYIALVMASAYFMNRARQAPGYANWALAGALAGMAYLASPQAMLLPVAFLVSQLVVPAGRRAVTLRRAAVLSGSFAAVALPYVAFLSLATGTPRLEGKTIVNNELGKLVLAGVSDCEAGYEVTEDLEARGVWMRPNAEVARSAGPADYGSTLKLMVSKGSRNLARVVEKFTSAAYLGAPLIALLVVLGLLRAPWSAGRFDGEILLMLVLAGGLAALMTQIHMFMERYYFFVIPFVVIWAANGVVEISRWTRASLANFGAVVPSPRAGGALAGALAFAGLVALFAIGYAHVPTFVADSGPRAAAVREAGEWLAAIPDDKIVMDTDTPISFHAGARYVPMPCCDSETALRFARKKGVGYIVVKSWTSDLRPYMKEWWNGGVPSPHATLVHSAGADPAVRVLIYKLGGALAPERAEAAAGPLRPSAANPRYFATPDGRPVYLAGSHTWANFQDRGPTDPPARFDYAGYLDFLERERLNFFRLWTWENARWGQWTDSDFHFDPLPWERTGPGVALDGKPRFDLTRLAPSYFERLRSRVRDAGARGMYVAVMLFNGFSVERKGGRLGNPWSGHPFHGANNVNGIDGDRNGNGEGEEVHTLDVPETLRIQEAYVQAVVDAVGDLDNVLYEISNESHGGSVAWQYHMIEFVKRYQESKAKQHPVGMTVIWPDGANDDVLRSPADWISPNRGGGDHDYLTDPPAADGRKVLVSDTDHLCGECGDRAWVWKSLTRGLNVLYMDGYREFDKDFTSPLAIDIRRSLGLSRRVAEDVDLAAASPEPGLSSTGYCLAALAPGRAAYVVYDPRQRVGRLRRLFEETGGFTVDLTATPSRLRAEWLDPATGVRLDGGELPGGGRRAFRSPFAADAVLLLNEVRAN